MKKLFAALLLVMYFTVSTGLVVSLHYCMDRLASTEIGSGDSHKCDYCGMEKDGMCCRDDVKLLKLQTTHLTTPAVTTDFFSPLVTLLTPGYLITPFLNFTQVSHTMAHSPPVSEQDTYLYNRVFRI